MEVWLYANQQTFHLYTYPIGIGDCICRFGLPPEVLSVSPDGKYVVAGWEAGKGSLPLAVFRVSDHSVAGDLGVNDATLRQALHARGILTVGIPKTVAPIQPHPSPQEVRDILHEAGLNRKRTPHQAQIACACGYSRPIVESLIASLLGRGAARLTYKGHRGAIVQMGMTVMAHNAATVVRIQQNRLSKRAQKLRQLLRLKRHNINEFNAAKN